MVPHLEAAWSDIQWGGCGPHSRDQSVSARVSNSSSSSPQEENGTGLGWVQPAVPLQKQAQRAGPLGWGRQTRPSPLRGGLAAPTGGEQVLCLPHEDWEADPDLSWCCHDFSLLQLFIVEVHMYTWIEKADTRGPHVSLTPF